ncbi:MAG TPA: UMP kinase [Candidatus Cloacimonas sp.]|nr:UMP kinase [Candidatus Cloacimonas sp.]
MKVTYKSENIHRVLLKLSGEVLSGKKGIAYDEALINSLTDAIISVHNQNYELGIVLGGGNIFRGGTWKNKNLNRVVLDSIGMLATIQNSLYLAEVLGSKGIESVVLSTLAVDKVVDRYTPQLALSAMEQGKICFLSGGTGNPYFTTDTAAVLRAVELQADVVLKATNVDGLYSADPKKDKNAHFIKSASFQQCVQNRLGVMDLTAFSLAMDNEMPIKIFNISNPDMLIEALTNSEVGTYIHP